MGDPCGGQWVGPSARAEAGAVVGQDGLDGDPSLFEEGLRSEVCAQRPCEDDPVSFACGAVLDDGADEVILCDATGCGPGTGIRTQLSSTSGAP